MKVGKVIADYRFANSIGGRELAKEIGIAPATLNRIENGNECDSGSFAKIIAWLFIPEPETRQRKKSNDHQ